MRPVTDVCNAMYTAGSQKDEKLCSFTAEKNSALAVHYVQPGYSR